MADKYTVGAEPTPKKDDNKQIQITREWTETKQDYFCIADLEREISMLDNQIEDAKKRKAELEAQIKEAEKAIG